MILKVIGYRVETAGVSRLLDRIDEYPVKAHAGRALEVRLPVGERPGEEGKEIVDFHVD